MLNPACLAELDSWWFGTRHCQEDNHLPRRTPLSQPRVSASLRSRDAAEIQARAQRKAATTLNTSNVNVALLRSSLYKLLSTLLATISRRLL